MPSAEFFPQCIPFYAATEAFLFIKNPGQTEFFAALQQTPRWLATFFGVLFLLVNLAFFFFGRLVTTPSQPPGPALQGRVP
jgi:hypothetical protein